MRPTRPLSQSRTKSIEQQEIELDRSKHVHQILQYHESRYGQILAWLFTSQGLLGTVYLYLKSQTASAVVKNLPETLKSIQALLRVFPWFALVACAAILPALWSVAAANREFRAQHASDPYIFKHKLVEAWPVAVTVFAALASYAWLTVLPTLP